MTDARASTRDGPAATSRDRIVDGDLLRRLYSAHSATLTRLARRILRGHPDADGVVSTVFYRVAKEPDRLFTYARARSSDDLARRQRSYLIRATVNCCRDVLRERRRPVLEIPDLPSAQPSPLDQYVTRRAVADFDRALAKLGPRLAISLYLHVVLGYDMEEVAAALGSTKAAVRYRVERAKRRLRRRVPEGRAR